VERYEPIGVGGRAVEYKLIEIIYKNCRPKLSVNILDFLCDFTGTEREYTGAKSSVGFW
jgi:hypothetical protein